VTVSLQGNSPSTLTAGILLLSRSRSFGQRLQVEIVGDPDDISPVEGPALVHSPVLASCGVGRELGHGALVVVPGPPTAPLHASISPDGTGEWFTIDRAGEGSHPATRAFVQLMRERRPAGRELGRQLRVALEALGCTDEPALLDLLFGAPAAPLQRLALLLRAGRAMTGRIGTPLTSYLGSVDRHHAVPEPVAGSWEAFSAARSDGALDGMVLRVAPPWREGLSAWNRALLLLADEAPAYRPLVVALAEIGSHVVQLPEQAILPPLEPAMDAVAVSLSGAVGATAGTADAQQELLSIYRFLGGKFTPEARHAVALPSDAAPAAGGARWRWFCQASRAAADAADQLWRRVVDPLQ
jgi:hypothetical protein